MSLGFNELTELWKWNSRICGWFCVISIVTFNVPWRVQSCKIWTPPWMGSYMHVKDIQSYEVTVCGCTWFNLWLIWNSNRITINQSVIWPWSVVFNSLAPGRFQFNFQANFSEWWLRYLLRNCPQMNATRPYWWRVNTGSGNGLVPSGNKPLPELMLTQVYVAKWRHQASMS